MEKKMTSTDNGGNITPPPTPDTEGERVDDFMDSDSLDYMDFFTNEIQPSPQKNQPDISNVRSNEPLWFSCSGELRWKESIKENSLIGRGVLRTIKTGIMPFDGSFGITVFDITCQPEDIHYELEQYFSNVRQGFLELESGARSRASISRSFHDDRYSKIRYSIAAFYSLLSNHVHYLESPNENEDFLFELLIKIKEILVFIGPLYSLPDHVTSAGSPQGNESSSAAYHLLHAHLDVRWHSISLLHQLNLIIGHLTPPVNAVSDMTSPPANLITETHLVSQDSGPNSSPSLLDQVFLLVMWDAITILAREGTKKNLNDLQNSVGFSCSCSHELMVLMLHLIEHRITTLGNQSFWEYIIPRLLSLLKNETSLTSMELSISSQNNVSSSHSVNHGSSEMDCFTITFPPPVVKTIRLPHIWWIFSNIVKIYGFDENGKKLPPKSSAISESEIKFLRTLIKFAFGDDKNPTEMELRFYTSSCYTLSQHWSGGRSSQWAASLWDYFSRNLDSSFMLPGAGINGLACMSKTAGGWLEQVKSLTADSGASSLGKNITSWQSFLRIILSVVESSNIEWRRIRGRIYSNFHQQQMTKLQPVGIYNSVTLFLALATSTEVVDVSIKLCELLSFVPHSSNIGKLRIVVRGFMSVALLLVCSGCDVGPVAEKIAPLITHACKEYKNGLDAMHRRDMSQLLACYAEGIQEILEQSEDLSLNQHKFFHISGEATSFNMVIRELGGSEIQAFLSAMEAALRRVLVLADSRPFHSDKTGIELVDVIWRDFGGFMKEHATSGTPPAVLGTAAAALTLARLQTCKATSTQGAKEAAENFFIYFVTKEINPVCMVQYMSEVLSYPGSKRLLGLISANYQSQIVSGWITAVVVHGNTEDLSLLTSIVLGLPEINDIIPHTSSQSPFSAIETLVKALAKRYEQAPDFASRLSVRELALKYLSGLDRAAALVMKKIPLPSHIGQLLDLIATLFFSAPALIYVKGRPTLPLASLISAVLLPTSVYSPEKPLPAALSAALPSTMPKMLCGIASLGISQDQFLRRNLRDIFTHYVYRFSIKIEKNYTTVLHPFILCLHDAETNEATLQDLRGIFLEAAKDNYIAKRGCNLTHIQAVMLLLCELLTRSSVEWIESMCRTVLLPVLEVLLVVTDEITKRKTNDLLKEIMMTAARLDNPPRNELVETVRQLVVRHISWSSARLFKILQVLVIYNRPLMVDALPHISSAVMRTEEKRGTGLDQTLRLGYHALLKALEISEGDIQKI